MDRHFVPQANARAVAEAHRDDLAVQDHFGCKCMTYWIDEDRGNVFCLIEAPDKGAVISMHQRAHGLVPHEIIEVSTELVHTFLGRIHDPEDAQKSPGEDVKIFSDPAFRAILILEVLDYILLQHKIGKEEALKKLRHFNQIVYQQIRSHQGLNIELGGVGIAGSFASIKQAIACAHNIQQALTGLADDFELRMGMHAGFPVKDHSELFGNTIKLSKYLCRTGTKNQLSFSSTIRDYYKQENVQEASVRWLTENEETTLIKLMDVLESSWHNSEFDVTEFGQLMGMSKSTLYRTCRELTGLSPNALIQEFRLKQSLTLLRSQGRNVAQTAFETGFSSPSYFTKCFQKRFGLLPMAYLKATHET
jgi:AraC-like DNA-binding protein